MDTNRSIPETVQETDNVGDVTTYDYGTDLIRMNQNGSVYYYVQDGLGSTRALIDSSGVGRNAYTYDAFGNTVFSSGTVGNSYGFNGQLFDATSQQYYLRARYYNPSTGRFSAQDAFAGSDYSPVSLHRYLYADDNPVGLEDPTGNSPMTIGTKVHQVIGLDFVKKAAYGRVSNYTSVTTILGGAGKSGIISKLMPDLVDIPGTFLFEIKPDNIRQGLLGAAQLAIYLGLLNTFDPEQRIWRPGESTDYYYDNGSDDVGQVITHGTDGLPLPDGCTVLVYPPALGLMTYHRFYLSEPESASEFEVAKAEAKNSISEQLDGILVLSIGAGIGAGVAEAGTTAAGWTYMVPQVAIGGSLVRAMSQIGAVVQDGIAAMRIDAEVSALSPAFG